MSAPKQQRAFPVVGNGTYRPPDYARVVRRLSPEELQDDLDARRGGDEYLAAVVAEQERRQREDDDE